MCKPSFEYGITIGYFSYFPVLKLNRRIWSPWLFLLFLTSRIHHYIYTVSCHYIYTLFLTPGEWRSDLISVLFSSPCLLSSSFACFLGCSFLLILQAPIILHSTVMSHIFVLVGSILYLSLDPIGLVGLLIYLQFHILSWPTVQVNVTLLLRVGWWISLIRPWHIQTWVVQLFHSRSPISGWLIQIGFLPIYLSPFILFLIRIVDVPHCFSIVIYPEIID